jgi:hypothetical protein
MQDKPGMKSEVFSSGYKIVFGEIVRDRDFTVLFAGFLLLAVTRITR